MEKERVVPDVIDSVPNSILQVKYDEIAVDLGTLLTPKQVKNSPLIRWDGDPNKFYVLCMVDPDAPARKLPLLREVCHYMVGNIPGSDISKGEILASYAGSGPPKYTGLHRYIFLLYEQPQKVTFDEPTLTDPTKEKRMRFKIREFAKKYNLGQPIAGNFFQAGWDDSVPSVLQFLMGKKH